MHEEEGDLAHRVYLQARKNAVSDDELTIIMSEVLEVVKQYLPDVPVEVEAYTRQDLFGEHQPRQINFLLKHKWHIALLEFYLTPEGVQGNRPFTREFLVNKLPAEVVAGYIRAIENKEKQ
jgi:hypothetical protein